LPFAQAGEKKTGGNPERSGSQGWDAFPLLPGIHFRKVSFHNLIMKPLGICWIAYGILRVCVGVALVFLAPTTTVMFGALLARVADPYTLMGMFHALYIFAIALSFVCGILGIAGGIAIFGNVRAGRGLLMATSLMALSGMPLGIALGVYTLIVLLPTREKETKPAK
jgi:hypothetical protein